MFPTIADNMMAIANNIDSTTGSLFCSLVRLIRCFPMYYLFCKTGCTWFASLIFSNHFKNGFSDFL